MDCCSLGLLLPSGVFRHQCTAGLKERNKSCQGRVDSQEFGHLECLGIRGRKKPSPQQFSVLQLFYLGGGCNKDFINFGEWVGVLKVKLHYWLILRQGAENASFT